MRSFVVAVALLACACGDVVKVPDAHVIDAYSPDGPNNVMCGSGEMSCNGTCANVMTSELYCGNCTTQCSPTQGCLAGSCVPANTSCQRVKDLDPMAANGLYRNPNNNAYFFCDFTNSMVYEAMGFGAHTTVYAGWTLMSAADFNDPIIQKAFIALYNEQIGLNNLQSGFSTGNCCFKASDSPAGMYLALGGHYLYPARTTNPPTTNCGGPYSDAKMRFYEAEVGPYAPLPMPDDYFTTHMATNIAGCSDSSPQPGFFMRRRAGLN
jgi:hypothetical protein